MSNFIPLPPTYAVADPQVRAVLDVLARNMQVVIEANGGSTTNTTLTSVGGGSTFGSGTNNTNVTNLAPSYTLDTLTADLKRGAAEVITGALNGTTIMKLEPAGQYVVFQHKDAVVLGTTGAYAGTVRTALGITSTGILGGYNRQSDGAWQTTFAIESATGNLTLLGELRANSIVNVGAYLGSQTVSSVLSDVATASSDAAAAQAAVANKLNKNAADILSGGITFSSAGGFKTGTISIDGSGNATGDGVAFTSKGIVGRTSAGTTFTLDATTGAATFKGDITGGANITTTGDAVFLGDNQTSTSIPVYDSLYYIDYSAFGNGATSASLGNVRAGVLGAAISSGSIINVGVVGYGTTPSGVVGGVGVGVLGSSNYIGGYFSTYSSGGVGLVCAASSTSTTAFQINQGRFIWGSYSIAQPTGSSTTYLRNDGQWSTVGYADTAGTSSDSSALGGYAPSSWARIFPTNSGTANAGGSGLNLMGSTSTGIAGAYVGTTGSGNTVTFDVRTTSPSDIRLKEEVANIDLGLSFVNQLRPVSYKLKADPKHQKGYGFIADEVEDLIELGSSLVYEEPDWKVGDEVGFKTIHYPSYIAVLTKAIQELSAKVTVLESKNA